MTALEIEYSLATRVLERELLGVARELGVGIVAYGVLSRGLLSGVLDGRLEPTDFRAHLPRFTGDNVQENRKRVEVLRGLATRKGCTPAQIAIAWVLHQGEDVIALIGTTKRSRLRENLDSLQLRLSPQEVQELSAAFPEGAIRGGRYPDQQMGLVVR